MTKKELEAEVARLNIEASKWAAEVGGAYNKGWHKGYEAGKKAIGYQLCELIGAKYDEA